MTKADVIRKAIEGHINWLQAADILRVSPRHMRRLRDRYERFQIDGLRDRRTGRRCPSRIPAETVGELCRLRQERYPDFSVRHFYQFITEKHGLAISETWTRIVLQSRGLAPKAQGRGKYRRKRERRPMAGMLVHLDGSTHTWIPGLPQWDLVVALDDADGRILFACFFEEEGTASTLEALKHVLTRYGRFSELYTDRGSHFCRTSKAAEGPDEEQNGQVAQVLQILGIRHILARSPEARGRGERAFGTIQGRLPQELRVAGVHTYAEANRYLRERFVPDFNRRFTVTPREPGSAFTPLAGIDLRLLLSIQHDRVVQNDNTVVWNGLTLQLSKTADRAHFVRCKVVVHELLDGTLAVSLQGRLLGRFTRDAVPISAVSRRSQAAS